MLEIKPVIMISDNGVLNEIKCSRKQASSLNEATDFILQLPNHIEKKSSALSGSDEIAVMPNAVETITLMNRLVDMGVRFVFHSNSEESDQVHLLEQIDSAIALNNIFSEDVLKAPKFSAMVVGVNDGSLSTNFVIAKSLFEDTEIIKFNRDAEKDMSKAQVRQAIAAHFKIKEHKNHFVLEADAAIIRAAQEEGYTAYQIDSTRTTLAVLSAIERNLCAKSPGNIKSIDFSALWGTEEMAVIKPSAGDQAVNLNLGNRLSRVD